MAAKFNLRKKKSKVLWMILGFLAYIVVMVSVREIRKLFVNEDPTRLREERLDIIFEQNGGLEKTLFERSSNILPLRELLEVASDEGESTTEKAPSRLSSRRPEKKNCSSAAIEHFPRPLMSPETRRNGGLIVHFLVTFYLFIAIAIVCDEYFVPSLEIICDRLDMSEDVAGATFMAAGSSAPELATAVIGVFIAKDDIGVSGVIGSAVFNILFVIAVCALFAGHVVEINWWPLIRDCVSYCFAICGLLMTIYDEEVTWYESVFLLILYALYIVLMVHNRRLEEWANTLNVPFKKATREEKSSLFGAKTTVTTSASANGQKDPSVMSNSAVLDGQDKCSTSDFYKRYGSISDEELLVEDDIWEQTSPLLPFLEETPLLGIDGERTRSIDATEVEAAQPKSMVPEKKNEDVSPWEIPVGLWERIIWVATIPLVAAHYASIPDCRKVRWQRLYFVTFIMSMVWIALYSYIMVWMITIIGFTLGIPDTVMGLTFIAVGVSVPDALSSLCVAKQGFGDMAVSNAIGSNVFDILVCLGLPWFMKTVITDTGSMVPVESRGLTYSTLSLFSTVVFLIAVTHLNGWKLDIKLGIVLLVWYFIFMTFASLYELNMFGEFNPPICNSAY